jgi:hypothetical protein
MMKRILMSVLGAALVLGALPRASWIPLPICPPVCDDGGN